MAAAECGYSQAGWRKVESGESRPPIERLEPIAAKLGADVREWLLAWARQALKESPQTRQLFADAGGAANELDSRQALVERIALDAPDAESSQLLLNILNEITRYRRNLTSFGNPRRQFNLHQRFTGQAQPVPGKEHVFECPIGSSRKGLGFYSSYVLIQRGWGAFHRHSKHPYHDAGTEFFSVLRGLGRAYVQVPEGLKKLRRYQGRPWESIPLEPTSAGYYRGDLGHAFLASPDVDLLLHVCCVPHPPPLPEANASNTRKQVGYAEGVEFRLDAVARARIPATLKRVIKAEEGQNGC